MGANDSKKETTQPHKTPTDTHESIAAWIYRFFQRLCTGIRYGDDGGREIR